MNESTVVAQIKRAITRAYPTAVIYKIHGSMVQEAGIPDLLVCVRGRFVGLEVKFQRPGESRNHAMRRTSERQAYQIDRIRSGGGWAATVLSPDEALAVIREALVGPMKET